MNCNNINELMTVCGNITCDCAKGLDSFVEYTPLVFMLLAIFGLLAGIILAILPKRVNNKK